MDCLSIEVAISCGEGVGLTSGEGVGLTSGEGVGLTSGEGVGLTSGEGVRPTSEEGVGLTSEEGVRLTSGEGVGLISEEGVGLTSGRGVTTDRELSFPREILRVMPEAVGVRGRFLLLRSSVEENICLGRNRVQHDFPWFGFSLVVERKESDR